MTEQQWLDTFADNLRDMLRRARMTQRDLADASGLSDASISYYLNKRKMPNLKAIINIAYALDCSLDELIDFGDRII